MPHAGVHRNVGRLTIMGQNDLAAGNCGAGCDRLAAHVHHHRRPTVGAEMRQTRVVPPRVDRVAATGRVAPLQRGRDDPARPAGDVRLGPLCRQQLLERKAHAAAAAAQGGRHSLGRALIFRGQ